MTGTDRVDATALVAVLGRWADGVGPLYRLLAAALSQAIDRGDLPGGARLPAERAIADALPAARGTVVAAFGLLVEDGLVERRQGSGSTVKGRPAVDRPALAAGLRAQSLTGRALRDSDAAIELGLSVLDDPESLPERAFAVDAITLARAGRNHGYAPLGVAPLRERVAELVTARGWPTTTDEIAITLGVQHGIALAAEVLEVSGRRVAIEDPTYPGAIDVYSRAGSGFAPVRTDAGGTDPGSLRRALAGGEVGVVHLAPQCASPTGVVTVASRRAEITDALERASAWLVEDAALEFLAPPEGHGYLGVERPDRTILLGTTSKVFWGGLRVGWMRAPAGVIDRVGRLRAAHDLGSSIAPQITALRLLDEVDEVAGARRAVAAERRRHLAERLRAEVSGSTVDPPSAGLSLWVPVPDGDRLVAAAAAGGLDLLAGRVCSVSDTQTDRVRISAWAPLPVLDEAAVRFGDAWRACRSDHAGESADGD